MKANKEATDTGNYVCSVTVNTSAIEALQAVNNVKGWWNKAVEGTSENQNDEFTVKFGTTWKTFKITELVPGTKVVWRVLDCNMPWNKNTKEWTDSEMSWEATEENGATKITFTHYGLANMNCGEVCIDAWGGYIKGSLKGFIETCKGSPD